MKTKNTIKKRFFRALTLPALLLSGCMMLTLTGCDKEELPSGETEPASPSTETAAPEKQPEVVLYVSPDAPAGGDGSENAPFSSIAEAKKKLKTDKPESASVILADGTYMLDDTLSFNFSDCRNVTYQAADGAEVVVTGAECLTGTWDGTEEINGHTAWVKSIPNLSEFEELNTLYDENGFLTNARYPSKDGYLYARAGGQPQNASNATFAQNLSLLTNDGDLPDLSGEDLGNARIRICHYWAEELSPIDSYDPVSGELVMVEPTANTTAKNDTYCIENLRCALDEPGEWYIDYRSSKLYYLPRDGETQDKTKLYAGKVQTLLDFTGAKDITFDGITFAYTNWIFEKIGSQSAYGAQSCIAVDGGSNINFQNCSFRCIGATCLNFGCYSSGTENCTVKGCSFDQLGMQAVVIGGANNESEAAKNITVTDCYISNYGKVRYHAAGILQTYASGCTLSHNEISNGSYTAISAGWTWGYAETACHDNVISDNVIYHIGHAPLSDMGGIYTLGNHENSVISGNVIFDVCAGKDATTYGGWGIYPDEGSSGFSIYNNVVYDCGSQGYHQHYGLENDVYNNIFAFNEEGQVRSSRTEDHNQFTLHGNILAGDNQLMYQNVEAGRFKDPGNLYFDYAAGAGTVYSGSAAKADSPSNMNIAVMEALGYYQNAVMEDPFFLDPENRNFDFADTKAAETIGFTAIDYSKAGSPTFGSAMLLNTLKAPLSSYPASLVSAYETAKEAFLAKRNADTIAAMKTAFDALHALDDAAPYLSLQEVSFCNGTLYDTYTAARDAILSAAEKREDIGETSELLKNLKAAYTAVTSSEGKAVFVYAFPTAESSVADQSAPFATVLSPEVPACDGYLFTGWNRASDGTLLSEITAGCGEETFTAVFTPARKLSFDGLPAETRIVGAGMPLGTLPVLDAEGKIFGGWTPMSSESSIPYPADSTDSVMPDEDLTLYPVYLTAGTLIFDEKVKNVTLLGDSRLLLPAFEAAGTLPTAGRKNSRFLGWNTEKDGSGTMFTATTKVPAGETHLWSQWEACYTLSFDNEFSFTDAGFQTDSTSGSNAASLPVLDWENESITFIKTGDNCFLAAAPKRMTLEADHTYRIQYTFTEDGAESAKTRMTILPYDKADQWGSDYYVENLVSGNAFSVVDPYTRVSIRPGADSAAPIDAEYCYRDIYLQDITDMEGKSEPKLDGRTEHSRHCLPGAAIGALPVMTCPGYTFKGWNTAKDGSGETFTENTKMPEKNVQLWPVWEKSN